MQNIKIMNIIDRFSEHLKDCLSKAMILATELGHKQVEPIHLFFALTNLKGSMAHEIIGRFKTDQKIIEQLLFSLPVNKKTSGKNIERELDLTPFSKASKQIIEKSISLAYTNKHNYVGSEHLLSTLVDSSDKLINELFVLNKIDTQEIKKQTATILENSAQFPLMSETNKTIDKMQQNLPDDMRVLR